MVNEKKLNLACGNTRIEGYAGIDYVKLPTVDYVMDLETFPWDIESDSVEEIVCNHYVEHTKDLVSFMNEVYRICKVGARVNIVAPYYTSMRAWQDPTHVREISEASFAYYNKEWRKLNNLDHYTIKTDFDFTYGYGWNSEWANRSDEARAFALKHYNNVVDDIYVTLTKRGEQNGGESNT